MEPRNVQYKKFTEEGLGGRLPNLFKEGGGGSN